MKIQWESWFSEHPTYLNAISYMTTKSDVCWKPRAFIYNWRYPYKSPGSNHVQINSLKLHYFIFKDMALMLKPNQQNLSLLLNFPPLTARNILVVLIFWLHLLLGQQERRGLEKSLGALLKDWGEMSLLSDFLWEAEETSTCCINLAVLLTEPSAPAMGGKAPLAWNHRISNAGKDF